MMMSFMSFIQSQIISSTRCDRCTAYREEEYPNYTPHSYYTIIYYILNYFIYLFIYSKLY